MSSAAAASRTIRYEARWTRDQCNLKSASKACLEPALASRISLRSER